MTDCDTPILLRITGRPQVLRPVLIDRIVVAPIRVGHRPRAITVIDGAVWVTSEGRGPSDTR